uniref:Uncharacterized protein n=1 Tax=Terrapene triunguis TaxID=2587831 RepID=A0A674JZA0_9SAUR
MITESKVKEILNYLEKNISVLMAIAVGARVPPKHFSRGSLVFVSISFIVLMIISSAWLIFYFIQKIRYTNTSFFPQPPVWGGPPLGQGISGSPGFKKCLRCKESIPVTDGHSQGFCCLGEEHIPQKCGLCQQLKPRSRKDGELRLKLLLTEAALQSSKLHQDPRRRKTSPQPSTSKGDEPKEMASKKRPMSPHSDP